MCVTIYTKKYHPMAYFVNKKRDIVIDFNPG